MKYEEVNDLLRVMARKVISLGFKKTNIGRTIFGASSYPMFLRFINEEEEKDFGIKPLERAADVIDYDINIVFTPKNQTGSDPLIDEIEKRNKQFVIGLEDYLVKYLSKAGEEKQKRSSSLDAAVDDLLGISGLDDETFDENDLLN